MTPGPPPCDLSRLEKPSALAIEQAMRAVLYEDGMVGVRGGITALQRAAECIAQSWVAAHASGRVALTWLLSGTFIYDRESVALGAVRFAKRLGPGAMAGVDATPHFDEWGLLDAAGREGGEPACCILLVPSYTSKLGPELDEAIELRLGRPGVRVVLIHGWTRPAVGYARLTMAWHTLI